MPIRTAAAGKSSPNSASTGAAKPKKSAAKFNPIAPERVGKILEKLRDMYPSAKCALHHSNAWELLVATILSAQCTDVRVNIVTPELCKRYQTPQDFAALKPE